MRFPLLHIALVLVLVPPAQSQVFKCSDPGGRTVYSDRPCRDIQTGQMLLRERTFEELAEERDQAQAAQYAKEQRRAAAEAREQEAQEHRELEALRAARQAPAPSPYQEHARRLAERNAGVRSIFEKPRTLAERGLPSPPSRPAGAPPAPSVMTHCAGGFCHDNQGGVYHLHGNGTTMTGPGGGTCVRAGPMVHC